MYPLCKKNPIEPDKQYKPLRLIKSIIPYSGKKKRIDDQPPNEKL